MNSPAAHWLRANTQYDQFTALIVSSPLALKCDINNMIFEDDRLKNGNLSLKQSLFVLHTLKMWIWSSLAQKSKKKERWITFLSHVGEQFCPVHISRWLKSKSYDQNLLGPERWKKTEQRRSKEDLVRSQERWNTSRERLFPLFSRLY